MYLEKYDLKGWYAIATADGRVVSFACGAALKEKQDLTVLFHASDAASLMTGSIVLADGGYTVW